MYIYIIVSDSLRKHVLKYAAWRPHSRQSQRRTGARCLRLVWDAELTAGEIASHFELTRPAVSQHLGVLKEAGLVSERRDGTRRLYRASPQGLVELKAFLDEFWGDRLEALKREAEREEREQHGKHD